MNVIDPVTLGLVQRALDASSLRHAAIAQNIANVGVAGAPRASVSFEEALGAVRDTLRQGGAVSVSALPEPQWQSATAPEGLSLEHEMADLSRNSMHYQVLLRAVSKQISFAQLAVTEGKR